MSEAWLLPYSDLMTLLLAVFIVLFAVSQLDKGAMKSIADSFRGITGTPILDGGEGIFDGDGIMPDLELPPTPTPTPAPTPLIDPEDLINLEELKVRLDAFLEAENLGRSVVTHIDERGLVISLSNSILFDSGRADLKPATVETLSKIGSIINTLENYIRVEGHTDDVPISTDRYPSNWELSGARAARVVRHLVDDAGISMDKMAVVGYGESRPVADNSTLDGRARNRRVDIILLNLKYNSLEGQQDENAE
jgi:chemotaxis protein MotB